MTDDMKLWCRNSLLARPPNNKQVMLTDSAQTVFLAHLLLTVPRTGRRIDFHSSDEDFRLEVETSRYINVLVVLDEF